MASKLKNVVECVRKDRKNSKSSGHDRCVAKQDSVSYVVGRTRRGNGDAPVLTAQRLPGGSHVVITDREVFDKAVQAASRALRELKR